MFTGLIETVGRIERVASKGRGMEITVDVSGLKNPAELGASIAIDGVCLTVTGISGPLATFDAVTETISRSALSGKGAGSKVNLEGALRLGSPLDGHLVLGHVDAVGTLLEIKRLPESCVMRFSLPENIAPLVAEKGSVAVSGISLTVVDAERDSFTISVIPETLKRTILGDMEPGAKVNLEVDVLARYVARLSGFSELGNSATPSQEPAAGSLNEDMLRENGFI